MLGLELRARHVVAVVVEADGKVAARAEVATTAGVPDAAVAALGRVVGSAKPDTPLGIVAPVPDAIDGAAVIASLSARYDGPFRGEGVMLSGVAAASAEAWIGAARGARDVVLFAVADHTMAGVVRHGEPVFGAHHRAPAIGWLALNPVEREDYRKTGCLEAEVAAAGIVRRLIWRIKSGDRSRVQDQVGGDLAAITAEQVLDAARGGDGVSISVVRDTAKYLGMAAANLVAITDPEVLVLGGMMASASDLLFEPVKVEIARRLPTPMMQALTIVPAALGEDAAAIGAARLASALRS